jgi:DNA invertase Pin-like site-specific DNA recombinase
MYKRLNNRLFEPDTSETIAQIFLHVGPVMIIYTEYCTGYGKAVELFEQMQKRSAFVRTLEKMKYRSGLGSLLITPIQRLPRYNLLLRDLLKHTPNDHPEYNRLAEAIEVIQRLCDRLDVCTSNAVNVQTMVELAGRKR